MNDCTKFYIDGQWVEPLSSATCSIVNPATEQAIGVVSLGSAADVDRAVSAARAAFETFSRTTREARIALLERIATAYKARYEDIACAISEEVGAPITLARGLQAATGSLHIDTVKQILTSYEFHQDNGSTRTAREPIGVCGLITPWNWPINQIAVKVLPAIAAGCTVVVKPSEITPTCASILAEVMHAAGVPQGVFNLVHGEGPVAGEALAAHTGVDMVSFTGSTRGGVAVAKAAADTVKRVTQELGGKSPNIILPDADLDVAIPAGVEWILLNSGQSCSAPTRMLVPRSQMGDIAERAKQVMQKAVIGDPRDERSTMGPLVSQTQFDRVQRLIQRGLDAGATLVCGGVGRPAGLREGFYVQPTVFSDVTNDMQIAREEIFGPVLSILAYDDEQHAVQIANDTQYGLAAYVASRDISHARRIAEKLRAGSVYINGAGIDPMAPFGGYKQSGNGREWGRLGFEEFLEVKSMPGFNP